MRLNKAPITRKSRRSIALTLVLFLFLPVFVLGLLQNESFDPRREAFDDVKVSDTYPCVITFPNVNPYTLEVNRSVRVQVDAISKDLGIKSLTISDTLGNQLIQKTYDSPLKKITESFLYTPKVTRAYNLSGRIVDISERSYECVVSSPYGTQGLKVIAQNSKPTFTSSPSKDSKPAQSITLGTTYEYTIQAQDIDKDTINYVYSFSPGENWLKATVVQDGSSGKLSIKLRGSTQNPGSYLANIFIHDGYSRHLSSQSWVISVSPKGSEIPTIKIVEPVTPVVIGEERNIIVSWETFSSTPISKYEIYISSNPTNENSWQSVNTNVSGTASYYNVDLTNIPDGAYRIIVRAIDSQTPPVVGMDISQEIVISRTPQQPDTPDDKPVLPQPQIINISPTSTDEVVNTTPTIKASLLSPEGTTIDQASILVKIDDKEITNEVKINKISDSEFTLIYIPEQPLSTGVHKIYVSMKDSEGSQQEKDWTFTISGESEVEDGESFNIFGLEINKRTVYIIAGGLGLIAFAILLPIIISAMWKDKTRDSIDENYALPRSLPSSQDDFSKQYDQPKSPVSELTNEVFDAPEPVLDLPTVQQAPPPEPVDDLSQLYNQIENLEQEDKGNSNSNST